VLRGEALNDAVLHRAGEAAVEEVEMVSDSRGSSAYKQALLRVHLGRAMHVAAGT
jgi:CO/xanthine dehydrogenase FAD-binding subunit